MRSRRMQVTSVATVGVVVAGLVLFSPASPVKAEDGDIFFPVPNSNTLTGPTVYTAGITGAIGAQQTTVVARAWPKNSTLDALAEGTEFNSPIVSYGTRAGVGNVALKVASSVDTSPYVNEDGTMNLTVYTYVGDELRVSRARTFIANTSSTSDPAPYTAAQTSAQPSTTETVTEPSSGGGGGTTLPTNTTTLNRAPAPGSDAQSTTANAAAQEATAPDPVDVSGSGGSNSSGSTPDGALYCQRPGEGAARVSTVVIKLYKRGTPAPGIFGATWSNISTSLARFTMKRGQSSTFGVGIGASIGGVEANMGYTNVSASSTTLTGPDKVGAHAWFYTTQYRSDMYQKYCQGYGSQRWNFSYEVRPVSQYGGGNYYSTPNKPNAFECAYLAKGYSSDLDRSRAVTWSNGLKVAGLGVNVSLSSQTGYTTNAIQYYKANTGGMYICGKGGGPSEDTAMLLAASKTIHGW